MRLLLLLLCVLATSAPAQSLPGLTITGNTFTYDAPDGQVSGILRIPSGEGPFPAVLVSHGKGGTAGGFSLQHANILVTWGFVCIGPSYTHEGSAVNPSDNEGYCPENSRRARRCLEILGSMASVDMARLALFSHSMGSFLSGGLAGEIPSQIKAACISAGGTSGTTDTNLASPATHEVQGITAPFLMLHGTVDTTVLPSQSVNLQTILNSNGVASKRLLYQGINHDIISTTVKRADIHATARAWYTQHGVLAFAGNTAPEISAPGSVTVTNGSASAPISIVLADAETALTSLTLTAFSTDDTRLPGTTIALGGSGANRTMTLTPPVGQTGDVELALVVHDGQLSAVTYLQVTIENQLSPASNFRPEISWIADQRTTPGAAVSGLALSVSDVETEAASLTVSASSSNPTLLPVSGIVFGGSGTDRTVSLQPAIGQSGVATITVTVSDGVKSAATAFALTVAAAAGGNTAPTISAVPGETIVAGTTFGPATVIVQDSEQAENSLVVTAATSNPTLVPVANIVLGGVSWGRTVEVSPAAGQSGRVTVTLTVSDGTNTSSTAFVLDVMSGQAPPSVTGLLTVQVMTLGEGPATVTFGVADADTSDGSLRVTATSSNSALLADGGIVTGGSGASRSLTLAPVSGQTGAVTVTLRIRDEEFTRRAQLLLVVNDPAGSAAQFSRPRGVFVLDSSGPANYTTTFGKTISLRDGNIRSHAFVDGLTLRVAWSDLESAVMPGSYDFFIIQNALTKLPAGQEISLIVVPGEPDYIAATPGGQTWSDAGTIRATPWDPYLRERRRALFQAMGNFVTNAGVAFRDDPRLDLIDPYLPGGFTGIRDPNSTALRNLPGYTRQKLLAAVQDELRSLQDAFPGKFVQIGFWPITDNENGSYGGLAASEWLRQELLSEFNGITRPRVGFFMENLAAKRSGPLLDPYSATPVSGFASALFAARDATWNGFQMLGNWTRPFNDSHVTNTLYGSPNEAMEHAFNSYRAEYHEVYVSDIDNPDFQPGLQRWHDFFASAATTNPASDEDGDGLPLHWEETYGLSPVRADPAWGDADADRLGLLLEYALNQSPVENTRAGQTLTASQVNPEDGQTYLMFSYLRRSDAPHLTYIVEVSDDLNLWQSGPAFTQEVGANSSGDGVTDLVTVRILPAITAGMGPRFVHLRVAGVH